MIISTFSGTEKVCQDVSLIIFAMYNASFVGRGTLPVWNQEVGEYVWGKNESNYLPGKKPTPPTMQLT